MIYTDEGVVQEFRTYGKNPELVLVETAVIAQAPPRFFAAGMGDALATQFEARTCVAGHVRNMRGGASTRSALALAEPSSPGEVERQKTFLPKPRTERVKILTV